MTGIETIRARGKCIANALVCQVAELFCILHKVVHGLSIAAKMYDLNDP